MFLNEYTVETKRKRKSKLGVEHEYCTKKTICVFRCDNCSIEFERERGSMDPKRLSNNYFHVCSNCDAKVFAQSRGSRRRTMWKLKASSDIPVSKL